eukprot:14859271-Ditylum_brightwellii.AAC.1
MEGFILSYPAKSEPPIHMDANDDEIALDNQEYEGKYKEAPPVSTDFTHSPPLPSTFCCQSNCPCKLNKNILITTLSGYEDHINLLQGLDWNTPVSLLSQCTTSPEVHLFFAAVEQYEDPLLRHLDYFHPLILDAKLNNSDTLTWSQATRESHPKGFWEPMWVAIVTLLKMNAFKIVPKTKDIHVIMSTWAFCIKCFPTGLI